MKLTYSGKHANVAVRLPNGRRVTAERGETISVSASEGKILTALPGWDSPVLIPVPLEED